MSEEFAPYVEPAHPDDILVCGWLKVREQYPQFNPVRQVFTTNATQNLYGRSFRNVFVDDTAFNDVTQHSREFWYVLERIVQQRGGTIYNAANYEEVLATQEIQQAVNASVEHLAAITGTPAHLITGRTA